MNNSYSPRPPQRTRSRLRRIAVASATAFAIVTAGAGGASADGLRLDNDIVSSPLPGLQQRGLLAYTPVIGPGFRTFSMDLPPQTRKTYTLRLVESQSEWMRSAALYAAAQITANSDVTITVAPGTVPNVVPAPWPTNGDILLLADSSCGPSAAACAGPAWSNETPDGRRLIVGGRIWVNPAVVDYTPSHIQTVISHELGHALGLDHFDSDYLGQTQVMNSGTTAAGSAPFYATGGVYREGDKNGLRFLSALSLDNDILPPSGSAMPPGPAPGDYPTNMGYTPLFSKPELRRAYTIRLVGADSEPFRSAAVFAAQQWKMETVADVTITVAPGTIAEPSPSSPPNTGEILLDVAAAKCAGNATACTRYPTLTPWPDGKARIESGHIWLAPAVATYSTALIRTIVSHQLGHALGLGHHNGLFDGQFQVMNTVAQTWTSGAYQEGDKFGQAIVAPPQSQFLQRNDTPPYAGSGPWSGVPELSISYGYTGDLPLKGDWDGDGVDTVGAWGDRLTGVGGAQSPRFHLKVEGGTDIWIRYEITGDRPIAGDWNGDGIDTIGVLRGDTFYLRASNAPVSSFTSFTLPDLTAKPLGQDDRLLVGDWDGDGIDTIAIRRGYENRSNVRGSWWSFYHTNSSSTSATRHRFGIPTHEPVIGDWDGDGTDSVGIKSQEEWLLWNALYPSGTLVSSSFGEADDKPLAGDWDGDGDDTVGTHRVDRF